MSGSVGYAVAALIGLLVGATEIAFRYRDNPGWSVLQPGGFIYTVVNAAASGFALYVVRAFGWTFGAQSGSGQDLLRVLIAGLGAVALFRTKLFSPASQNGQSLSWGPSHLLEQLLAISDTLANRSQAAQRSRSVAATMANVSFTKAQRSLPTYALGLLENTSAEEQDRLAKDVKALSEDPKMSDAIKAQQLGVALIRLTGPALLNQAVSALGRSIAYDPAKPVGSARGGGPLAALARRRR